MSDKTDIEAPRIGVWYPEGSTVLRLARVLEQVNVSDLGSGGKLLDIETVAGRLSISLDASAAAHVAALLLAKEAA